MTENYSQADEFEAMLRQAELERAGTPVSRYMDLFSDLDEPLIPPQRGDCEPTDSEIFLSNALPQIPRSNPVMERIIDEEMSQLHKK